MGLIIRYFREFLKTREQWETHPIYSIVDIDDYVLKKDSITFHWVDVNNDTGKFILDRNGAILTGKNIVETYDAEAKLEAQLLDEVNLHVRGKLENLVDSRPVDRWSFEILEEVIEDENEGISITQLNFSLDRFTIDNGYKIGEKPALLCLSRNKIIVEQPEEVVRQKFIQYLIERYNLTTDSIKAEDHLAHQKKGLKDRADLVIINEDAKPLFIVECKSPDIPLSDRVVNQALRYNNHYNVNFFMLTNGKELAIYAKDKDGSFYLVEGDPDLDKLHNGQVRFIEKQPWERVEANIHELPERIRECAETGEIHKSTPLDIAAFALKIQDLLYDHTDLLLDLDFGNFPLTFKKDLGVKNPAFGNPAGFIYQDDYFGYRTFILNDGFGDFTMHLGCYSSGFDYTYLYVGITNETKNSHVLELRLDTFLKRYNADDYAIQHNFQMQRREFKDALIDEVQDNAPFLWEHQGRFNHHRLEYLLNDPESKDFLKRILIYGYLRNKVKA